MLHFTPECLDLDDELHSPRFLSAGTEAQGSYSRHPRYHTDASSTLILDEFSHQVRAAKERARISHLNCTSSLAHFSKGGFLTARDGRLTSEPGPHVTCGSAV